MFLKFLKQRYLCRETVATFAFQWLQPSDRVWDPRTSKFLILIIMSGTSSKNDTIKLLFWKKNFESETPQGVSEASNLKKLILTEFGNFRKFFPSRFLRKLFNRSFLKLTLEIQKDAEFSQLQNAPIQSSLRAKIANLEVFW